MLNAFKQLCTALLMGAVSIQAFGLSAEMPPSNAVYTHSFCAELKSLEFRVSTANFWGVAQVYNEVSAGSPISLITDHMAVQVLMNYLPFTQMRMTGEDKRSYWNSTMENGKYLVCLKAERGEDETWGGRIVPNYNRVHQLRLIHKGDTIFVYGKAPEESLLNI